LMNFIRALDEFNRSVFGWWIDFLIFFRSNRWDCLCTGSCVECSEMCEV
jgi:hypothetical protein